MKDEDLTGRLQEIFKDAGLLNWDDAVAEHGSPLNTRLSTLNFIVFFERMVQVKVLIHLPQVADEDGKWTYGTFFLADMSVASVNTIIESSKHTPFRSSALYTPFMYEHDDPEWCRAFWTSFVARFDLMYMHGMITKKPKKDQEG